MTDDAHVLVIEDDQLFATLMADTLQQDGFRCTVANTLSDARALLERERYAVIVTDVHLPDGAGAPVLDMLARHGHAETAIIVITGQPSVENAMRAMDISAFAYRTKPLAMGDLLATVRNAARHHGVRQRLGATRERLHNLELQLDALRNITRAPPQSGLNQSLAEYILLLLGSCGESLSEAVDAFRLVDMDALEQPVRHLSRHPEAEMFRAAIEHAIGVLERTRSSFKSRELADLRQKLEAALAVAGKPAQP